MKVRYLYGKRVITIIALLIIGIPAFCNVTTTNRCYAAEKEVFFDDFENLSAWVETGEGDWRTESVHAKNGYPADGSNAPVAHSDNCDSNCTLTLAESIDLSNVSSATLSFLRFIDRNIDAGEYLTVELYDGYDWSTVYSWTKNNGNDNQWRAEQFDLGEYVGSTEFSIRLRTSSSSVYEHVEVDDVRVVEGSAAFLVSQQNLVEHVAFATQSTREPGSPHIEATRTYSADYLQALGYDVEIQPVNANGYTGQNIIGARLGTAMPDEIVIVSAHVDHIAGCPGADDNASGLAGALETARLLAQNTHQRTIVVAIWDFEEAGMIGSRAYARRAQARGDNILVNFVYEMIGYKDSAEESQSLPAGFGLLFPFQKAAIRGNQNRGDFIGVFFDAPGYLTPTGGRPFASNLEEAAAKLGLNIVSAPVNEYKAGALSDVLRSDHSPFWESGYPALMITDTAEYRNPNYHCGNGVDDNSTLDFTFMRQVTQATAEAALRALD